MPKNNISSVPPGDRVSITQDSLAKGARFNGILNSLSGARLAQLLPKLKDVGLKLGYVLYEPEQTIEYVYFPTSGIISLLAAFEDGTTVEAGVIGTEGMLGTPVALGAETTPHQALVQMSGQALRMTARDLKAEVEKDGDLLKSLLRYTNAMFIQVAQTAGCNRAHSVEQRLARWLLITHDRVAGDEFDLTQEFISRMLGVRRAGVSVAANTIREVGAIEYQRGRVKVLDRTALERITCECYEAVKAEYERNLKTRGAPSRDQHPQAIDLASSAEVESYDSSNIPQIRT